MSTRTGLFALPALLTLALPFPSGDPAPESPASGMLVRVAPGEQSDPATEAGTWREALRSEDLERRMKTFERMIARARTDPATHELLEELARSNDLELAWTARLALRELASAGGWLGLRPFGQGGAPRIFRWNVPPQGVPGLGAPQQATPFGELEERVRELERMFQGFDSVTVPAPLAPVAPPGSAHSSRSYRIEIGPDGARVEVQESEDGEEQVKTFQGKSLEELLETNPELEGVLGLRGGSGLFRLESPRGLQRWLDRGGHAVRPAPRSQPPTHVLGIEYRAPKPDEVLGLGLEPGVGLLVERTVPGTIAHLLGIERGDVVVDLNGNRLFAGEDVSRVLRERLPEADVAVGIVDRKGLRRTLTWRPAQEESDF